MDGSKTLEYFLSVLFLPALHSFVQFAWGANDPTAIAVAKRVFLLLPVLSLILGYWVTVVSALSLIIRAEREAYVRALFATWWELGRAIFTFWGGFLRLAFALAGAIFGAARLVLVSLGLFVQDLFLTPFRLMRGTVDKVLSPGTPWIAVGLTFFWCTLEAVIFTFVMTPLVIDTLSNMTGQQLTEGFVRIPLFLFMIFVVLGSYSVLSTWTEALRTRDVPAIIKVSIIEAVAMFVEIIFLYREFVDALVPWFAQHSAGTFDLGVVGTLAIAGVTWVGIRALSWMLFASSGTPTLMAIIQGSGLKSRPGGTGAHHQISMQLTANLLIQIKKETEWFRKTGEDLLGAFLLPPLQIVAGAINFCTLLITSHHLFKLPFRDIQELRDAREIMQVERKKAG
jgi:hypothetical protein